MIHSLFKIHTPQVSGDVVLHKHVREEHIDDDHIKTHHAVQREVQDLMQRLLRGVQLALCIMKDTVQGEMHITL